MSTHDNNQRYLPIMCIITYLIKSFLKKHSIKNDQKFSVCISPTGNSYVPPNINVFQQNFVYIFQNGRTTRSDFMAYYIQGLWKCPNSTFLGISYQGHR